MTSLKLARSLRLALVAAVLAAVLALGLALAPPAVAQTAQAPSGSNPTAATVTEQQLLNRSDKIRGIVTIPDKKEAVLEQPQGRGYRGFHETALPWLGGVVILGMLVLLAVFYFIWGQVRTQAPPSGVKIVRFNVVERFNHWMTATAFIVLAITGLNYVFGKRVLMPLIGPDAFSAWSHWAKYAHNFISWVFMLGVLIMFVLWIKDNFPNRYDWAWLKAGGGFLDRTGHSHPPAARFNAGQKLIFWAVVLGGAALSVSGILLLFPFSFADISGMQTTQYVHAVIGMLLIAVILAHIYIGTIGMAGAYDAMGTGEVDLSWAKEHHRIWVERQQAKSGTRPQVPPGAAPAE